MTSGDAYERLRAALKSELQKHFGQISEIEAKLSRSQGYLSKFCRGDISIPVEVLLKSLELLQRDPGQFLVQALGVRPDSANYLRGLAATELDKGLAKLERAALELAAELEVDEGRTHVIDLGADPAPEKTQQLVAAMFECSGIEQRRRLRSAERYRNRHFVVAYSQRLFGLSYDDPKTVIKQAEVVGTEVVPLIEDSPPSVRLALLLDSLAVYGFAQRRRGAFDQAAAATIIGLGLGRQYRLERETANLLKIAAYVLSDHGHFEQALQLLGEALVTFDELDDEVSMAKAHAQRGMMYLHQTDYLSASRSLRKALRRLPEDDHDPTIRRYRLSAYQGLSHAWEFAGDLEQAESWLDKAEQTFEDEGGAVRGKLLWARGNLAYQRGDAYRALSLLTEARETLMEADASEQVMISLQISRILIDLGRPHEARELALGMSQQLKSFRQNKLNEAALVEYLRTAMEADVSIAAIDTLESALQSSRHHSRSYGKT